MQGQQAKQPLTFRLLDNTLGLSATERETIVQNTWPYRLGPLVEYAYQDLPSAHIRLHQWDGTTPAGILGKALTKDTISEFANHLSITPHAVEFIRIPLSAEQTVEPQWIAFCKRLEAASGSAGLFKLFAAALAGTFGEMADNALQHSDRPNTAIVGYRWTEREFEYVVSDAGIGVFASLRKHPDYASLRDSSEALFVAIKDGESRRGRGSGHGAGFHKLIHNVARNGSFLRFRSDDHCLIIDGTGNQVQQYTKPCSPFRGFLISVICRAPKNKFTASLAIQYGMQYHPHVANVRIVTYLRRLSVCTLKYIRFAESGTFCQERRTGYVALLNWFSMYEKRRNRLLYSWTLEASRPRPRAFYANAS
jgi:hypothetical protein